MPAYQTDFSFPSPWFSKLAPGARIRMLEMSVWVHSTKAKVLMQSNFVHFSAETGHRQTEPI
jgi:hypothetical protein